MDANKADNLALVIETAVDFMAHQGNVERVLTAHRRLADGLCSGCLTQVTRWPCSVAAIALRAQERRR